MYKGVWIYIYVITFKKKNVKELEICNTMDVAGFNFLSYDYFKFLSCDAVYEPRS